MKKHQEEMLFRTAANSYVENENEEIRQEMEKVDDIFRKMAEENSEIERILDKNFSKKKKAWKNSIGYKVAVIFLVIVVGFGAGVITVPALRNAVKDLVNYVTGEYSNVGTSEKEKMTQTELEKDITFDKEYKVNYLPDGFIETSRKIIRHQIEASYHFKEDSEKFIVFTQMKKEVSVNIDTEEAEVKPIEVNGLEAMLVEKKKVVVIYWKEENYSLMLESVGVSSDELIKVAKSIH